MMRNKSLLYLRKVVSSYSRKIKSCACFVVLDWYKLPSRDDHNIQPPIRPISHFCKTVLNFPSPQLHNHLPKNTPTGSSAHPASPDSMSTCTPFPVHVNLGFLIQCGSHFFPLMNPTDRNGFTSLSVRCRAHFTCSGEFAPGP
jgi:hypothetical protein